MFLESAEKNYNGQASKLWLSRRKGRHQFARYLASVLKIANLKVPQHVVVGLNKPLMVGSFQYLSSHTSCVTKRLKQVFNWPDYYSFRTA